MNAIQLDHMILPVNELDASVEFYTEVLGLERDVTADRAPFTVVRVTPDLTIQLAPFGTEGGVHLAFSMDRAGFDEVFDRLKTRDIPYGDRFHQVGNMKEPGIADGARGDGVALYCFDPNQHLIEIRHYE
jgi:catechol 2,3-dioxygenase-like lactoylglutathione lyase family enzyme